MPEHLARTLYALTRTIVGAKGAHRDSLCKVAGLLSHAADELIVARNIIRPARPAPRGGNAGGNAMPNCSPTRYDVPPLCGAS